MRKLFINSIRQEPQGDFILWAPPIGNGKPTVTNAGNYIEAVMHRRIGVTGTVKIPGGSQDIRSYELVIHHSAIHGDKVPPEMVRFDCPAVTVDLLLKKVEEGTTVQLRPVLVTKNCGGKTWKWFVIAVNGHYLWANKRCCVPHSNYEYLYGKEN